MKKKLNYNNLLILIVFITSATIVIGDLLIMITHLFKSASWTCVGIISFGVAIVLMQCSLDYLVDVYKQKKRPQTKSL